MKNTFTLLLLLICGTLATAQQCNPYFNLKKGGIMEMENFNAKDKKTGKVYQEVKELTTGDNSFEARMYMKNFDKKDKATNEGEYALNCNNGIITIDMQSLISPETLQAFGNMEVEVNSEDLEIPAELVVGDQLKDGKLTLTAGGESGFNFGVTVNITNRKVEKKEQITTPAGTFECFKITYDVETKSIISARGKSAEYISEGHGVVKSESFDKNGKLTGYSILTRFE